MHRHRLIFFVEKRKRQHAKAGTGGARWADAIAVATVMGMLVAATSMLVANRVLPDDLPQRGDWEKAVFWGAWVLSFLHAGWRSAPVALARLSPAWREQCWAVAALACTAVALNWLSTGDHLLKTLAARYWPVAGFDLALLVAAALAATAALSLGRRERAALPSADRDRLTPDPRETASA